MSLTALYSQYIVIYQCQDYCQYKINPKHRFSTRLAEKNSIFHYENDLTHHIHEDTTECNKDKNENNTIMTTAYDD